MKKINDNNGFSLVEFSVAIIIMGVILATSLRVYDAYLKKQAIYQTRESMDKVIEATSFYFANYGRYPCVAPLDAGPGDPGFGEATDCNDTASQPVGNCAAGSAGQPYCVEERLIDHDGNPSTPLQNMRVRIGSVPFRQLNEGLVDAAIGADLYTSPFQIGSRDTVDSYNQRFTYAVTERQATNSYMAELGAIRVEDESTPARVLADRRDYVIVSHGADGIGARTYYGELKVPCGSIAQMDTENCDMDTVFVDGLHSVSAGANYFDDMVVYRSWMHYFLWAVADDDPYNTHTLNTGNVGIGTMTPAEKLHVSDGNLLASGNLLTNNICEEDGTRCFTSELIAGSIFPECANGQITIGIENSAPECIDVIASASNTSCPSGEFLEGFEYNTLSRTLSGLCRDPDTSVSAGIGSGGSGVKDGKDGKPSVCDLYSWWPGC